MKKYIEFESNHIYNNDCMEIFKNMPDESIDLVVSDIPYRILAGGVTIVETKNETSGVLKRIKSSSNNPIIQKFQQGFYKDAIIESNNESSATLKFVVDGSSISKKWAKKDNNYISAVKEGKMFLHNDIKFKEWLPELYRVLKKRTHCYLMINSRNLKDLQTEAEKVGFVFQNILIWDKGNVTPNKYYMQGAEFILMMSKRPARNINIMGSKNIIRIKNNLGNKLHPTEKPVELMEYMIKNSSNKDEVVLDPFCGVGATLIAAKLLNRKYIGIDIETSYCETTESRLNNIKEETKWKLF